jgi:hypothetical protein
MHLTERAGQGTGSPAGSEKSEAAGAPELEVVERVDDVRRGTRKLANPRDNLPMSGVAGFVQAYLNGDLNMGMFRRLGDQSDGGFVISARRPARRYGGNLTHLGASSEAIGLGSDLQKPCVFTNNVKLMHGVEQATYVVVPSVVRFQGFDDKSLSIRERLYEFGSLRTTCGEYFISLNDWKVNVINKVLAVTISECHGENVQATADRININSGLDLERQRQRLFLDKHYDVICGITWQVFDDRIRVDIDPSIKASLKGWELGYGPIDGCLRV